MRINEILMKSKIIKYNKILNKYHNEINQSSETKHLIEMSFDNRMFFA